MLKPWQPGHPFELVPVELDELPDSCRNLLLSHTIEFVSLGLVPVGDFDVRGAGVRGENGVQGLRSFQSSDGAVLGWIADLEDPAESVGFVSLLEDGTCVKSTTAEPHAPWSCCRFPVYVNFGAGCSLEDLLVLHLSSLAELEHGCGPTLKYAASQVCEIVAYMSAIEHETEHGLGAPPEMLPDLPAPSRRELVAH